jgi:hypothetical protein
MTEQPPRRPGYSAKVEGIRQMTQSPEYQRRLEEGRRAEEAAAAAREASAAADAKAQQEIVEALAAAKIKVFPAARKGHVTVSFSCTPRTAQSIAALIRQHADGSW